MHGLTKFALGIAMLGGTAAAAHANVTMDTLARAHYDAHQPCHYYLNHNLPGPKRCTRFFSNALGSHVYVGNGFVFRDHDTFVRFRDRGWFKDETRLAAREDTQRAREDRAREHEEMQADEQDQYADRDADEGSGGASRGDAARNTGSGGASRGAMVYPKVESGGAGHGEHVHQGGSGGASGY